MLNLPAISEVQLPKHFFALVVLVPSCSASSCGVSTMLHPFRHGKAITGTEPGWTPLRSWLRHHFLPDFFLDQ